MGWFECLGVDVNWCGVWFVGLFVLRLGFAFRQFYWCLDRVLLVICMG